jgi:hypothetical protein
MPLLSPLLSKDLRSRRQQYLHTAILVAFPLMPRAGAFTAL